LGVQLQPSGQTNKIKYNKFGNFPCRPGPNQHFAAVHGLPDGTEFPSVGLLPGPLLHRPMDPVRVGSPREHRGPLFSMHAIRHSTGKPKFILMGNNE
jgi:hypothetical protein